MNEPALELEDIQGHVLVGFGGGYQMLLGLRIRSGFITRAKAALSELIPLVTKASKSADARAVRRRGVAFVGPSPNPEEPGLSISFSRQGLGVLGAFAGPNDRWFQLGAAQAAAALQDDIDANSQPIGWEMGYDDSSTPHVFLVIAGATSDVLTSAEATVSQKISEAFDIFWRTPGQRLPGDCEHFGFVDGISQPAPRGTAAGVPFINRSYPPTDPLFEQYAQPGQALVWPGQYLFGYPTQLTTTAQAGPISGDSTSLMKNGSLLVFRKLHQDVGAFRAAMAKLARDFTSAGLAVDPATTAAWCIGRWPDGSPVALSPSAPNCALAADTTLRNAFLFRSKIAAVSLTNLDGSVQQFPGANNDPNGSACPFFAHIRKVNPRDAVVDFDGSGITLKSQMMRRGVPYGPAWTGAEDGQDRGLLFMSYQTSIESQFHRLMTAWVNSPAAPPTGQGIDPLIGAPQGGRILTRRPASKGYKATLPGRWVVPQAAGYFFAPGISALNGILSQN